jgi:hypothetical protein
MEMGAQAFEKVTFEPTGRASWGACRDALAACIFPEENPPSGHAAEHADGHAICHVKGHAKGIPFVMPRGIPKGIPKGIPFAMPKLLI